MSGALARAKAALTALALLVCAAGCAHSIRVESEPPGATVFVGGKRVGTTPVELTEVSGGIDRVPVEVVHGERAARFAYTSTGISSEAVGAGAGLAGAMCLGGTAGVFAMPLALVLGTGGIFAGGVAGGPVFVALLLGGYCAYFGGLLMASYAPYALIGTIGEAGRIGPDRIHVDLRPAVPEITSQPANMVEPWVGRSVAPRRQRF
ncbi:MAG: PEGA domain-containing protein [Deltaproteobacteria bacterium]|nr:PEGA domain-containing protein [Deltaproteobacteria bacterium]